MASVKSPFLDYDVDGLLWTPGFAKENYYLMKDLPLKEGDVILSTYPKCGTNWMACIIWLIIHPEEDEPTVKKIMSDCLNIDEEGLASTARLAEEERFIGSHIPLDRMPKDDRAKYITIVRNPFDCVVSYFIFMHELGFLNLERDGESVNNDFFEWFMAGHLPCGDFFAHVLSGYNRRKEDNLFFITFEELKKDHKGVVLRIARFLGRDGPLVADEGKLLDKIVHQSSFTYMKENFVYEWEKPEGPTEVMPMMRKGKVGGFRNSLTPEQVTRLREKMEKELAGTELLEIWGEIIKKTRCL